MSFEVVDIIEASLESCTCHCHDEERGLISTLGDFTTCMHCNAQIYNHVFIESGAITNFTIGTQTFITMNT